MKNLTPTQKKLMIFILDHLAQQGDWSQDNNLHLGSHHITGAEFNELLNTIKS